MAKITSRESLRALYPQPTERVIRKQLDRLDAYCRRFIGLAPFAVVATGGDAGLADASPRGGAPGFAVIEDDATLLLPDWPGNNRLDTLGNIVEDPRVGIMFMVPGIDEVLRVNGTAEVLDDEDLRARFTEAGKRPPRTVIRVHVREAYLHCAKAIMRARLWDPGAQIDRSVFPSVGQMIKEQTGMTNRAETQEEMLVRYKETLY